PIADQAAWKAYVRALLKMNPSICILIKPHRNEFKLNLLDEYRTWSAQYPQIKVVPAAFSDLYGLIGNVDAVLVELSTIGIESMLCGVPTLFLRKPDYLDLNHDYYYKATGKYVDTNPERLAARTLQIVESAGERALLAKRMRRFLSHAYPVPL